MSEIEALLDRADELGVLEPLTELIAKYVDAAEQAADAYEENREERPSSPELAWVTDMPAAVWVLGELRRVEYDRREGKTAVTRYHDFETERPMLAVDDDEQLWIVGGDYRVTARGIVG